MVLLCYDCFPNNYCHEGTKNIRRIQNPEDKRQKKRKRDNNHDIHERLGAVEPQLIEFNHEKIFSSFTSRPSYLRGE